MNIRDPARARKLIEKYEKLVESFLEEHVAFQQGWKVTLDEMNDDFGGYIRATVVYPADGPTPDINSLAGFWDVDRIYVLGRKRGVDLLLWSKAEHPTKMSITFLQKDRK